MFLSLLIGGGLLILCVLIHAVGSLILLQVWMRWHRRGAGRNAFVSLAALVSIVFFLFGLHILQVLIWATTFLLLPYPEEIQDFEKAVYFSIVTYTTVGYGDVTLAAPWRLMAGIEALSGILMFGWSTALLIGVVQRLWLPAIMTEEQAEIAHHFDPTSPQ
jgi:hypothetical protein